MGEFIQFIITNMTFIYFRGLIDVSIPFANQASLLLGLAIGNDGLVEAFFLSLLLRGVVLGVVNGAEEDELALAAFIKVLVAVMATLVLLFRMILIVEVDPQVGMDWMYTHPALWKEPVLNGEVELLRRNSSCLTWSNSITRVSTVTLAIILPTAA